jgi:hypothetical protein
MTDCADDEKKDGLPKVFEKKDYMPPDFEEESVFETLAAGCTFSSQLNPACKNGKLQFSA